MTVAMADKNRMPEQQARDNIDLMLEHAGSRTAISKPALKSIFFFDCTHPAPERSRSLRPYPLVGSVGSGNDVDVK